MAYFAEIDDAGVVQQVISISNNDAPDPAPAHSEALGQAFIRDVLGLPGEYRQTSFNGNFRKQFAGIGWRYDAEADVFIAPQPFPSWSLNEDHDWQAPVQRPPEGGPWMWDETSQSWVPSPI